MVAAVLTMLAFVLAFIFNMTASRFDTRKQIIVDEVNAISTAYLRADLLSEPDKLEVKRLLREYVDIRLRSIKEKTPKIGIEKSVVLQDRLWLIVTKVAKDNPIILNTLLLQSINEVIDIHEKRVNAALRNRIPGSIWFTLMAIIAFSMITLGSQTGLAKARRLIQVIPTILAFSALITVVVDLDRPAELGLIEVNQQAMLELQENMAKPKDRP